MLVLRPVRLVLGQISSRPFQVVVTDSRGLPWEGARVTLQGVALPQVTDDKGMAIFEGVPSGQVQATIELGDYHLSASGNSNSTLFVSAPICAPGPIISKTEAVVLLAGVGLSAGGFYWEKDIYKTIGEILIGGAVFTNLYRNSCRW